MLDSNCVPTSHRVAPTEEAAVLSKVKVFRSATIGREKKNKRGGDPNLDPNGDL